MNWKGRRAEEAVGAGAGDVIELQVSQPILHFPQLSSQVGKSESDYTGDLYQGNGSFRGQNPPSWVMTPINLYFIVRI